MADEPINEWHYDRYGALPIDLSDGKPVIQRNAPPHADLQLRAHPRVRRYRLWVDDDVKELDALYDKLAHGESEIRWESRRYVRKHQNWILLISWVDYMWGPPPTKGRLLRHGDGNGKSDIRTIG